MIPLLKMFISIILSVINLIPFPYFGDFTAPYAPLDGETVQLSFAAISDVHATDETARRDMLRIGLYDMEHAAHRLDAVVVAGDLTDHGYIEQWERLAEAFSGYDPAETILLAIGNHDTWTEDEYGEADFPKAREYFIEYNKKIAQQDIAEVYYATEINGYPFIFLGSEGSHTYAYISEEQISWLAVEMQKAAQTGLPIFVISHWPINQTHGLPETWGEDVPSPDDGGLGAQSDAVEAILKQYENVFFISGHLHSGFSNSGSEKIYGYTSVESDGSFHSVNLPSYMYLSGRGRVANGTGYHFEVYEDKVALRARSFTASVWYTDYDVEVPLV
ncbi:MAG: hypothetical protein GX663_10520 [Clostridiales bacterium]|nr:hypothetical protein [Clostridiales bacterium]